ncbi:MAG: hypothetical protein AB4041_15305 [Microcystaceae cyanobacterium]
MKNPIRQILNLDRSQLIRGYTLFELLIAGSLTSLIISSSGLGWLGMVNLNQKSKAQSSISYNVNRAAEFIQEEIKTSAEIAPDAVSAVTSITGFTLPTNATPVLVLTTTEGDHIVYYTQPVSQPWVGPNGIYRWGYPLDENGNYDTTQSPSSELLIDNIDNSPTTVICPSGWQSSTTNSLNGFYACTQGTQLAQLNISSSVSHVVGNKSSYATQTAALARSETLVSTSTSIPLTPAFNLNGNELVLPEGANLTFEVIGGAAQCSSSSPQVPTDTDIQIDANGTTQSYAVTETPLNLSSIPAGAKVNVETTAYWGCISTKVVNTATENVMVQALRNGDSVPDYTPVFESQSTIDEFLQTYIEDGKIVLPDNQVIYLFETYTSNTHSSSFDLQDNVVLATIKSPN